MNAAFIVSLVVVVQWVACWVFVVVAVAVALLLLWPGCQTDSRPSCIVCVLELPGLSWGWLPSAPEERRPFQREIFLGGLRIEGGLPPRRGHGRR